MAADESRERLLADADLGAGTDGFADDGAEGDGEAGKKDCWASTKHVAEVLVLFVALFYVDMGLDAISIWSMWSTDNPKLAGLNLLGIVTAALLGFVSIVQSAGRSFKENDGQMITLGGLYAFQLHVFYLGYLSIKEMRLHPFLTQVKMMEATFEAAVSANVQAYFVVWSDLDPERRAWLLASILSSVVCLAFGYATFDVKAKGFDGVAGTAAYTSCRFLAVLVFRTCEVLVRVCGLALFNRACRPYGAVIEVAAEGLVWLGAIHYFGGWHFYAFPSVFAYMNPLLERNNAGSVPSWFYYAVRLVSLVSMLAAAVYWRGDELVDLFSDDGDFAVALAVASAGMVALLPVLRYQATDSLMQYDEEQWSRRAFTNSERRLLGAMTEEMRKQCVGPLEKQVPRVEALLRQFGEKEVIVADPAFKDEARRLLLVASNCPAASAPQQLQERLCEVLLQLTDRVPVLQEEVVQCGGVELALKLGEGGSSKVRSTALRLAVVAVERSLLPKEELAALGAVKLAQDLLDSASDDIDHDEGVQAVGVILASGASKSLQEIIDAELPPDGGELSRPQRIGRAVAYAIAREPGALAPETLGRILEKHGACPFTWTMEADPVEEVEVEGPYEVPDGVPSAYETLGGICVRALLQQHRNGVDGAREKIKGEHAEEWRWQMRTIYEYWEDLRDEVKHKVPRGNYTQEQLERDFGEFGCSRRMRAEFSRRWGPTQTDEAKVRHTAEAAIRSGGLSAVVQAFCAKPIPKHSYIIRKLLIPTTLTLGSNSPLAVKMAIIVASDDFLEQMPKLMAPDGPISKDCSALASRLCRFEVTGTRMVKVLEECLKSDAIRKTAAIAWMGKALCFYDKAALKARNIGLLEHMMERACNNNTGVIRRSYGTGIVVALLDESKTDDITKITSNAGAMSSLVDPFQGFTEDRQINAAWEPLYPMVKLSVFSAGRAALVKHNAVLRIRVWIAKELLQVAKGTKDPQRLRALNYAMQVLLMLLSTSKEAVEDVIKKEVKMRINDDNVLTNLTSDHYYCWHRACNAVDKTPCDSCKRFEAAGAPEVDDCFHSSVEAVIEAEDPELPWLFQQAVELQLYWAGQA